MKKFVNRPEDYVDEALKGLVMAHPMAYRQVGAAGRVIARSRSKVAGKVGVVSGGGFGHLPLFAGYVGTGLLDSCAVGDVFAGPSFDEVTTALRSADFQAGVLAVIGNYGGDTMVFGMAMETLEDEGIPVQSVIVADDVASAAPESASNRRGVAGLVPAFKVAGAAAERGQPLDEVAEITRRALKHCRSIGVALSPCTIPQVGKPTFELEEGSIEMGMGIHGEQGIWRGQMKPADELADEMLDRLLSDAPLQAGETVAVLLNSLGATSIEELFILYRRVADRLAAMNVEIRLPVTGHYATSMEMAGASLTLMKLDDELTDLLLAPTNCPFWRV